MEAARAAGAGARASKPAVSWMSRSCTEWTVMYICWSVAESDFSNASEIAVRFWKYSYVLNCVDVPLIASCEICTSVCR